MPSLPPAVDKLEECFLTLSPYRSRLLDRAVVAACGEQARKVLSIIEPGSKPHNMQCPVLLLSCLWLNLHSAAMWSDGAVPLRRCLDNKNFEDSDQRGYPTRHKRQGLFKRYPRDQWLTDVSVEFIAHDWTCRSVHPQNYWRLCTSQRIDIV